MKLGMIGLGRMGANMVARLLQAGHPVVTRFPLGIVQPGVVPHVQLLQRQGLDAEILE